MAKGNSQKQSNDSGLNFEAQLWAATDKMRGHMDASEYNYTTRKPARVNLAIRGIDANLGPRNADMPHAYTEDQLDEQPAIGLFAELKFAGWDLREAVNRIFSVQSL